MLGVLQHPDPSPCAPPFARPETGGCSPAGAAPPGSRRSLRFGAPAGEQGNAKEEQFTEKLLHPISAAAKQKIHAAPLRPPILWYDDTQTPQDRRPILASVLDLGSRDFCGARLGDHYNAPVKVHHKEVCREISGELQDIARWLAGSDLSPEQYRLGVTRLEDQKLKRFGLKLSSSVSGDGVVHFTLRFSDDDELCVSMDVDPTTGKLTTQPACR